MMQSVGALTVVGIPCRCLGNYMYVCVVTELSGHMSVGGGGNVCCGLWLSLMWSVGVLAVEGIPCLCLEDSVCTW